MFDNDTTSDYSLTTCPQFLKEYDRVQDSMAINSTPPDTFFDDPGDGLNYYLKQLHNEPTNISPPWYTEYNPLVYLGVFVLVLTIYKLKK